MAPYHYKPLRYQDEECVDFRLLILHPGKKGSMVCATLWHAPLDSPPSYEALSYVWGNPMLQDKHDPVDGSSLKEAQFVKLGGCRFDVGRNLYSALQHLRYEVEFRKLWIDALCIDQDNKYERGRQVRIMDQIYAKSSLALAWLGEADEDTDTALDAIEDICWAVKVRFMRLTDSELNDLGWDEDERATMGPFTGLDVREVNRLESILEMDDVCVPPIDQSIEDIVTSSSSKLSFLRQELLSTSPTNTESLLFKTTFKSMERFFSRRSYWKRLWIAQEIFFASKVQLICGSKCLDIDRFITIYLVVESFRNRRQDAPSATMLHFAGQQFYKSLSLALLPGLAVIQMKCQYCRRDGWTPLSTNLLAFTSRLCTEPVDRIFAILNFSQTFKIEPDYESAPADVFVRTTKAIIQQEQSLDVICFEVDREESRRNGRLPSFELPSFVPHYEAVLERPLRNSGEFYDCGGDFLSKYPLNVCGIESERSLLIAGCSWGRIVYRTTPTNDFSEIANTYQGFKSEFWKTLFGDIYFSPTLPYIQKRMTHQSEAEALFMTDVKEAKVHQNPSDGFVERFQHFTRDYLLYLTDRGDLVKASNIVSVGDEVFVARGCSYALILRQASEAKASAAASEAARTNLQIRGFVTGAYVHGIMDGEAIKKVDDREIEETKVLLI